MTLPEKKNLVGGTSTCSASGESRPRAVAGGSLLVTLGLHLMLTRHLARSKMLASRRIHRGAVDGIRPDTMQAIAGRLPPGAHGSAGALIATLFYIARRSARRSAFVAFRHVSLGGFGSVAGRVSRAF